MPDQTSDGRAEPPSSLGIPAPNTLAVKKELQCGVQVGQSTASSESQDITNSNEEHNALNNPSQFTNPTSLPSNLSDLIEQHRTKPENPDYEDIAIKQNRIDSDLEAQYGSSDGIRPLSTSDTFASSSSDGSQKEFPPPSAQEIMKGMGSHLQHPIQTPHVQWFRPRTDTEARVVTGREEHAAATNRAAEAFESHHQPDPEPELAIQRDRIQERTEMTWIIRKRGEHAITPQHSLSVMDIEREKHRKEMDRKTIASASVLGFLFVFFALSWVLYSNAGRLE